MKKRFIKPIKFLKKYEGKVINIEIYKLNSEFSYKITLLYDNDYTVIYSNVTFNSFGCYLTFCLFKENDKIAGCFLDDRSKLCINRDKDPDAVELCIDSGVPLL